jgi:plasmid stability protein
MINLGKRYACGLDLVEFGSKLAYMDITARGVPRELYRKLKRQAELNKRSLNDEVLDILQRAVERDAHNIEMLLADIDDARARIKGPFLTEELLRAAKYEGRP